MVAQIGPLVRAGKSKAWKLLVLHILGGATGGATIGLALGLFGLILASALPPAVLSEAGRIVIAATLIVAGLLDLRVIRGFEINLRRQTPEHWKCALGPSPAVFAWGFDLGLGFTTRLSCKTLVALPLSAVLLPSFFLALSAMTIYGLSRALVLSLGIIVTRGDYPRLCNTILLRYWTLPAVAGSGGIITASVLVLAK